MEMPHYVFLSFEREDIGTVQLFREHVDQEDAGVVFYDYAIKVPFDNPTAEEVKSKIEILLDGVETTLVMIGRTTYADKWVDWEVRKSAVTGKSLLGVRLHSELDHIVPRALKDYRVEVLDLDVKRVLEAIEQHPRQEDYFHYETG